MAHEKITVFRDYPFSIGEKIHILNGPRHGDWEVINISDKKIKLRCPVSGIEVEWARFCYYVDAEAGRQWPSKR